MAKLENKAGGGTKFWPELIDQAPPPSGQYVVKCIAVHDEFGVERRKFQSEETEVVDLTAFLFGGRTADNTPFKIDTKAMKISGYAKSALMEFLTAWYGETPKMGHDYNTALEEGGAIGRKALISLGTVPSRDGTREYVQILSVAPCPDELPVGPFGAKAKAAGPAAAPGAGAAKKAEAPKAAAPAKAKVLDDVPF